MRYFCTVHQWNLESQSCPQCAEDRRAREDQLRRAIVAAVSGDISDIDDLPDAHLSLPGTYTRSVGLWRWFGRKLAADDGYEPDPDEVVAAGIVSLAVSEIVLAELRAAGIRAEVFEQRPGAYGITQARIMCFAPDREAAAAIIDRVIVTTAT